VVLPYSVAGWTPDQLTMKAGLAQTAHESPELQESSRHRPVTDGLLTGPARTAPHHVRVVDLFV
jgi:hypothetical protein